MKKILVPILLCLFSLASFAQAKHADPRPLHGLDASKIPVLKSWKDLKLNPGGLLKGSVEIGKAEATTLNVEPAQIIAKDAENQPANSLSFWRILRAPNGTANWMWHISSKKDGMIMQSIANPDGMMILNGVKNALRIADPKSEFYPMSDQTDEKGYRHLRYGQIYQGVPVWNKDLYIHLDPSGEAQTINGTYEPTPINFNINPSITNPYSILVAIADLKAQNKWAPVGADVAKVLGYAEPSARLVIYPDKNDKLHLAYEVSVIPNLLESYYYLIDAQSGAILTKIARQCSLMPIDPKMPPVTIAHFATTPKSSPLQPLAGSFTNATGIDLNGVTQSLRTYQHTDGNFYTIWDLKSFDPNSMSKLPDQPSGGAITLNANNTDYSQNITLFHNTSTDNTWSKTVVSAHHNMLVTYHYYDTTFKRKAIDDKNSVITSIIHVTQNGQGMDNAFWNGTNAMIYGDGNVAFKPLAGGIDVAGHEMTHGVINATCNLVYQDQSGSVNESLADIFGVMVDTANLTVGEQVMKDPKNSCLRNLDNPHDPTALSKEPAKMSEYNPTTSDNGGVHTNSAIPSKAAAILIKELGRPDVQNIYYLAMTKYLTRNSQFIDCRLAIQAAAKELFKANSTQLNAVGPAFDSVEIFDASGTNPNQNDVPGQKGGTSIIAFTNNVGDIGIYNPNPNSKQFVVYGTAGSIARVSPDGSSRAQLTAPANGSNLWYISSTGNLNFLDVATGVVKTVSVQIKQNGDLWNAAVSPDESFVALTSAYDNDPNIYIFNGTTIFRQPLQPQSNDGPDSISSINYPDVVCFSPNNAVPKISFDALLDTKVGTDSIQYWSMYEIDYTAKKTYELFPTQGSAIDLGNVAYSSNSPNIITFNSLINGTDEDVWVADFENNIVAPLNVDKSTINGNSILDAQKPTFSPHDDSLVFASPSNLSLLFYSLSTGQLSFIQLLGANNQPAAVYQPYWFLVGGTVDGVQTAKASDAISLSIYPSVTSAGATADITMSAAEEGTLDIVNIFGMTVRPIAKQRFEAGSQEIKFNTEGLSCGTYIVRLMTNDGMKMEKMVIER